MSSAPPGARAPSLMCAVALPPLQLRLLQALLLLLAAAFASGGSSASAAADGSGADANIPTGPTPVCTLVDITLHYKGRPIDLVPAFRPQVLEYDAMLDFSMDEYFVDARPDTGCVVDGVPAKPVSMQIGGKSTTTLRARSNEGSQASVYVIHVRRLLGSETTLQTLRILGATMSPHFSPEIRSYDVTLDLSADQASVLYRLRDGEQRLRSASTRERPAGAAPASGPEPDEEEQEENEEESEKGANSSSNGTASGGSGRRMLRRPLPADDHVDWPHEARRLLVAHSGEVQFREAETTFMVDVGFTRVITLTVQCADATQANIGSYVLRLSRPGCSRRTPFFDPLKGRCVNFCESGYYKNSAMHRCAKCNENCVICASLRECQMCKADTPDYDYVVQPDGSCRAYANHIFAKYRWWCVGFASLLGFLVLLGLVGLCNLCCLSTSSSGSYKNFRTYSDSEEELTTTSYKERKRLGRY
eukprot:TRINITY_DN3553_c0_g2_i1.p1 TRINITY_DN3553_c0_g2~~TRINITY_DN3553_c0_g2_i1.p1  ORF type:complete len:517 (+),score=106.10 TRINITY_DN3553_c0_g2_i1:127-1551(+)